MKLYVLNRLRQKTYLNIDASTRPELAYKLGSPWFTVNGETHHVNSVFAESEINGTASGAVVGGIVGLLGGPIGLLIGGVLGGALGNETDRSEAYKVNFFNRSHEQKT